MEICAERDLHQPADEVWAVLRDFGARPWLASVFCLVETKGEGVGMLRYLYRTPNSQPGVERLDALDDEAMELRVSVLVDSFAMPITKPRYHLQVTPLQAGSCRIELCIEGEPAVGAPPKQQEALVNEFVDATLQKLASYLERCGKST